MKGFFLVALALLMGIVHGDQVALSLDRGYCPFLLTRPTLRDDPVTVKLMNPQGQIVQAVTNGDSLTVSASLEGPQAQHMTCLLGLAHVRSPLQSNACINATVNTNNTGTCTFHINTAITTAVKIQVRIAVEAHVNGEQKSFFGETTTDFKPLAAGVTAPPAPITSTTRRPTSTKKAETEDKTENEAVDPHDSKTEAFLAAEYAQMRQKLAEDEDKNSEGNWQKLVEDEKRQHEEDVKQEMEDYERRMADEKHKREEMIREEMRDKEEHDRDEVIHRPTRRPDHVPVGSATERSILPGGNDQPSDEVRVNGNDGIVVGSSAGIAGISAVSILLTLMVALLL